jgi:hypothetical protein
MSNETNACVVAPNGNIHTPKGKLSFPSLVTPRTMRDASPDAIPKFSLSILIPPDADISALKKAAAECAQAKWGDKKPPKLKSPFLRAGDLLKADGEPLYPEDMAEWTVLRPSATKAVGVVDATAKLIPTERVDDEAYSGRWARVAVRPFAYDKAGNRGVSFGLQAAQLLDHDTPMAGSATRAEDEFAPVQIAAAPVTASATASADDIWG